MVQPIPDGYHTITPFLTVSGVARLLEYVQTAFDATVGECLTDPGGAVLHAEATIGDSKVMVGEAQGEWKPMPASLYLYVVDCDAAYARALEAGGTSIMEPADQFYGDRNAGVMDPCGNYWWLATHVEDVSGDEIQRRAAQAPKPE